MTHEQMVQKCIEWIRQQKIIKTVNPHRSSYGYKHIVERWAGEYITEDAFIEAIKKLGINHRQMGRSKNVRVAISNRLKAHPS